MFIALLTSIVSASNHTKRISINNQICEIQRALIESHPNKYSQELHYRPFAVKLDKCVGSCNTLNKVCVANKTEDLNMHVFDMITGKNEQKF